MTETTKLRSFMMTGLTVEWGGGGGVEVAWYPGWHIVIGVLLFVIWRWL